MSCHLFSLYGNVCSEEASQAIYGRVCCFRIELGHGGTQLCTKCPKIQLILLMLCFESIEFMVITDLFNFMAGIGLCANKNKKSTGTLTVHRKTIIHRLFQLSRKKKVFVHHLHFDSMNMVNRLR